MIEVLDIQDLVSNLSISLYPTFDKETMTKFLKMDNYYASRKTKVLVTDGYPLLSCCTREQEENWDYYLSELDLVTLPFTQDYLVDVLVDFSKKTKRDITLYPFLLNEGTYDSKFFRTEACVLDPKGFPANLSKRNRYKYKCAKNEWDTKLLLREVKEESLVYDIIGNQAVYWKAKSTYGRNSSYENSIRQWIFSLCAWSTGRARIFVLEDEKQMWYSALTLANSSNGRYYFLSFARNFRVEKANDIGIFSLGSVAEKVSVPILLTPAVDFSNDISYIAYKKNVSNVRIPAYSIAISKTPITPPYYSSIENKWVETK
jgi:hypothetical protein